jgi:hypothetical protein
MRYALFGVVVSTAMIFASSSFAAFAVCASGYKAEPKMINGSEDYGQSYTCTGSKAVSQLVCSNEFSAQAPSSGGTTTGSSMSMKDEKTVYTCAEPATPSK